MIELPPLYAGTSGFAYPSWKPGFYAKTLPSTRFLEHYASRLNLVEVNYTFRQLAKAATFEKWIASTPPGFVFSPKTHNKITHILRLQNADEFTRVFLETLQPFRQAQRLGPILVQLPPSLKADPARLGSFLHLLPATDRFAFEFRHPSWFDESIFRVLRGANAALCLAETDELETPAVITADFVYFRLRKANYIPAEIQTLSEEIAGYRAQGLTCYALFKHEDTPEGALSAERLLRLSCAGRGHLHAS